MNKHLVVVTYEDRRIRKKYASSYISVPFSLMLWNLLRDFLEFILFRIHTEDLDLLNFCKGLKMNFIFLFSAHTQKVKSFDMWEVLWQDLCFTCVSHKIVGYFSNDYVIPAGDLFSDSPFIYVQSERRGNIFFLF